MYKQRQMETFTNKIIKSKSNRIVTSALHTTGSPVYINKSDPPKIGQILTACSENVAKWIDPTVKFSEGLKLDSNNALTIDLGPTFKFNQFNQLDLETIPVSKGGTGLIMFPEDHILIGTGGEHMKSLPMKLFVTSDSKHELKNKVIKDHTNYIRANELSVGIESIKILQEKAIERDYALITTSRNTASFRPIEIKRLSVEEPFRLTNDYCLSMPVLEEYITDGIVSRTKKQTLKNKTLVDHSNLILANGIFNLTKYLPFPKEIPLGIENSFLALDSENDFKWTSLKEGVGINISPSLNIQIDQNVLNTIDHSVQAIEENRLSIVNTKEDILKIKDHLVNFNFKNEVHYLKRSFNEDLIKFQDKTTDEINKIKEDTVKFKCELNKNVQHEIDNTILEFDTALDSVKNELNMTLFEFKENNYNTIKNEVLKHKQPEFELKLKSDDIDIKQRNKDTFFLTIKDKNPFYQKNQILVGNGDKPLKTIPKPDGDLVGTHEEQNLYSKRIASPTNHVIANGLFHNNKIIKFPFTKRFFATLEFKILLNDCIGKLQHKTLVLNNRKTLLYEIYYHCVYTNDSLHETTLNNITGSSTKGTWVCSKTFITSIRSVIELSGLFHPDLILNESCIYIKEIVT